MRKSSPTGGLLRQNKKNGGTVNILIMDSVDCATVCSEMSVTAHVTTRDVVYRQRIACTESKRSVNQRR
jgi:hypothetical protein